MILSFSEDVSRLYANVLPFNIRDLSICDSGILKGPGTNPQEIQRDNCMRADPPHHYHLP
jgi:hypothetical protein